MSTPKNIIDNLVPVAIRRRTLVHPGTSDAHYMGGTKGRFIDGWSYTPYSEEEEKAQKDAAKLFVGDAAVPVRTEVEVLYAALAAPKGNS